jgi:hypothetical protein
MPIVKWSLPVIGFTFLSWLAAGLEHAQVPSLYHFQIRFLIRSWKTPCPRDQRGWGSLHFLFRPRSALELNGTVTTNLMP